MRNLFICCLAAALVPGACDLRGASGDMTPLIRAAREGSVGEIARLLRNGADPNRRGGVNGWTPLLHAIHKEQLASVKALIDGGADVNAADRVGATPLMMAAGYGDAAAVKLLLAAGADPRKGDNDDKTALDFAVMGVPDIDKFTLGDCQTSTVRALLAKCPDLKLTNDLFGRAVHTMAKFKGCADVLALLDHGK